jgi:uncharacterized membrane protein YbhN (UPF0104 family)
MLRAGLFHGRDGRAARAVRIAAKVFVTAASFGLIWASVDVARAFDRIRFGDASMMLLATAVLAFQPWLGAARWLLVLRAQGARAAAAAVLSWTYVATFFSQVLPATVGADLVRSALCARSGFPWGVALSSVALDRIAMLVALVLLLAAVTPALHAFLPAVSFVVPVLLLGCAAGLAALLLARAAPASWDRFRLARLARFMSSHARRLATEPRYGAPLLALCFVSYGNIIVSVYLCTTAFHTAAGIGAFFVLVPPVLVASTLPVSIGGWGTRELAMIGSLGLAGVPAETAVLVSVWLGLASILVSLPGAAIYLAGRSRARAPSGAGG